MLQEMHTRKSFGCSQMLVSDVFARVLEYLLLFLTHIMNRHLSVSLVVWTRFLRIVLLAFIYWRFSSASIVVGGESHHLLVAWLFSIVRTTNQWKGLVGECSHEWLMQPKTEKNECSHHEKDKWFDSFLQTFLTHLVFLFQNGKDKRKNSLIWIEEWLILLWDSTCLVDYNILEYKISHNIWVSLREHTKCLDLFWISKSIAIIIINNYYNK